MALDALDRSICAVLGSDQFHDRVTSGSFTDTQHVSPIRHLTGLDWK